MDGQSSPAARTPLGKKETPPSYLHLHHLPFAAGAEGPLIAGDAVVVSALVPEEGDGVLGQGDHLVGACVGHGRIIHSFVHCQAGRGGVGGSVRVHHRQAVRAERGAHSRGALVKRNQHERTDNQG